MKAYQRIRSRPPVSAVCLPISHFPFRSIPLSLFLTRCILLYAQVFPSCLSRPHPTQFSGSRDCCVNLRFLGVAEGLLPGVPAGVEEVTAIATLQALLGAEHARAKLVRLPQASCPPPAVVSCMS